MVFPRQGRRRSRRALALAAVVLLGSLSAVSPAAADRSATKAETAAIERVSMMACSGSAPGRCEFRKGRISTADARFAWADVVGEGFSGALLKRPGARSLRFEVLGTQGGGIGVCSYWRTLAPPAVLGDLRVYGLLDDSGTRSGICGERPTAPCTGKVVAGVAEALSKCFRVSERVARSTDPVRINGVDLLPVDGADVRIDLRRKLVTTRGEVEIKLGWVRLARRSLRLDLARPSAFEVKAGKEAPADLAGLPLKGSAELKFEKGRTIAKASVELPTLVKGRHRKAGTTSPTVEIGLQADNVHGLLPETIGAKWPWLRLPGGYELTDVELKYNGTPDPATGQVTHSFEGGGTLWLRGVNPKGIEAQVKIASGGVFRVAAAAENLNKPLWRVVYLQRLGFVFGVNPLELGNSVGITAGPQIKVPTRPPFHISRIDGELTWTNDNPDTWVIKGTGDFALADFDGELKVVTTGKADLKGNVVFAVPGIEKYGIRGYVEGWLEGGGPGSPSGGGGGSWGDGAALLQGRVRMSMPGFDAGNVESVLSSEGVAGCRRGFGPDFGFGYRWGGELEVMAQSCGLGPWSPARPSAGSAPAGGGTRVRVRGPRRVVALRVDGTAGAPLVSVTGPGGLRVDTPPGADAGVSTSKAVVIKDSARSTTYVAIDRPARGTYDVTPLAGSPPIAGVRSALALRPVHVSAGVRGHGGHRRLRYRIANLAGARVHFVEQGGDARRVIGTASRRRGTLRFRPVAGSARRRRIVAVVVRDGLVEATRVVARYRARPAARAPRPRGLRIRSRRSRATISWGGRRAARYEVIVRTSDGRNLIFRPAGRRRRVVVGALPPRTRLRVTVRGYDVLGRLGPAARATRRAPR